MEVIKQYLLLETGDYLLQEDGYQILLDPEDEYPVWSIVFGAQS
jgi:hypothetical protein